MIRLSVREVKAHLSKYLNMVSKGETLVICKGNEPVAEVRAMAPQPPKRRPAFGLAKGEVIIHDSFFDPLPNELLDLFEGKGKSET